ncbi:pyridoxamine 5'-phosphate oxidase family protein [Granulosicoccus sp. 3-233]|uniref:pyridoxamine 5'-phosphate oxidase family protein n=1 Tax=Granulosicoccus sp. 3-233 TaxID=3417969 RepID=UPI003D359AEE
MRWRPFSAATTDRWTRQAGDSQRLPFALIEKDLSTALNVVAGTAPCGQNHWPRTCLPRLKLTALSMKKPDARFTISSEAELRDLHADTHALAIDKCLPALDRHCRAFIARSPFLCLSTQHVNGSADVSPRGDPPGFVQVLKEDQ